MRKRVGPAVIGASAIGLLVAAPNVDAAPKKGTVFDVTCPGLGDMTIVTPPGNGPFTPAFGPNQVFIPYEVTGSITVNGAVVDQFHDVKAAPVPAGALSCAFHAAFDEGSDHVEISGTAVVMPRGPKG
jgi:hypothetical protein